ncbi:hypothetical protein MGN70_003233 [Eutypa lata]|nr:hypothetical protein MGN70_003233 [Eutypa lata]
MLGWKILFVTSWGRFQRRFDNILDDLKHHGDLIDKEANALDIAEARDARQKIEAWREDSLAKLNQYYKEQNVNQLRAILTWLRLNDSEQLVIFEKVATEGSKHPGTIPYARKFLQSFSFVSELNGLEEIPTETSDSFAE